MAKRMKFLALLLVAALCVTAGYLEMNERYLGLDDNAFTAFAALNLDNNTVPTPAIKNTPTQAEANTDITDVTGTGGVTLTTNPAHTNVGGLNPGVSTIADVQTYLQTFGLTSTFFPVMTPQQIVQGISTTGGVAPMISQTFTSDNFFEQTPSRFTLYKLNPTAGTATALTYAANPRDTAPSDGQWALFEYAGGAFTYVRPDTTLSITAASEYAIITYIADNGPYDIEAVATNSSVTDPFVLGANPPAAAAAADDDDDDDDFLGCVANPAATLSLEWLLLCIAPALYWIRRRR